MDGFDASVVIAALAIIALGRGLLGLASLLTFNSSGSLAIFAAILRASSLLKQISNGVGLASSLARPRPQPFCHDKTEPPG